MTRRRSSVGVVVASLVGALLVTGAVVFVAMPKHSGPQKTAFPTVAQDQAMDHVMRDFLPAYTVAVNEQNAVDRDAARDRVRALSAGFDPELSAALLAVLEREQEAMVQSDGHQAADALTTEVEALNRRLAGGGYNYYADAEANQESSGRVVVVFTFRIADSVLFETPAGQVKALYLRRLDQLNWHYSLLAYAAIQRREISVLLDRVDEILIHQVLPALAGAAGRPMWAEDGERAVPTPAQGKLGEDARAAVRKELVAWIPGAELDALLGDVTRASPVWSAPENPAAARTFTRVRDRFAYSLARHEVQHIIDARNTSEPPQRARAELSAYLGELSRTDGMNALTLALLIGYVLDTNNSAAAESQAARTIFHELATELKIKGDEPEDVYSAILSRSTAEREKAAAAAWQRLFGHAPEVITSPAR